MVRNIKMFECKTQEKKNLLYRKAVEDRLPYFEINMGSKYGRITYDMITAPFILSKGAIYRLSEIFNDILYLDIELDSGYVNAGEAYGRSPLIPLDICKTYAIRVAKIVFDNQSWSVDPYLPKEIVELDFKN